MENEIVLEGDSIELFIESDEIQVVESIEQGPPGAVDVDVAKGFVNHGDDPDVARPPLYASVEWVGSVAPVNAQENDTWIDTST